jgi:hypothetical protein
MPAVVNKTIEISKKYCIVVPQLLGKNMRKCIVLLVTVILITNQLSVLGAAELQPVEAFNNALLVESSVISLCAAATLPLRLIKQCIYQKPLMFAVLGTEAAPSGQKPEDPAKNTRGAVPGWSFTTSQDVKPCFAKISGHIAALGAVCLQDTSPSGNTAAPAAAASLFVCALLLYIIILSRVNLPAASLICCTKQQYPTFR